MKSIDDPAELDRPLPADELLDAVGFKPRVHGRVAEYLKSHGMATLSPKQLMDLFLPALFSGGYSDIPILQQPQFGKYLYRSALLSLCDAKLGKSFQGVWAARIYFLKVYELRRDPANWPPRSSRQEDEAGSP